MSAKKRMENFFYSAKKTIPKMTLSAKGREHLGTIFVDLKKMLAENKGNQYIFIRDDKYEKHKCALRWVGSNARVVYWKQLAASTTIF